MPRYYYDTKTGIYYLQSRYYDANTGRFLNADGSLNPGTGFVGMNLFAYCNNNPVNMEDSSGHFPFLVITAAIGAAAGGIIAAQTGNNIRAGIGIGAAAGALIGLELMLHLEPDSTCGVPGALRSVLNGPINVFDVIEVGFK